MAGTVEKVATSRIIDLDLRGNQVSLGVKNRFADDRRDRGFGSRFPGGGWLRHVHSAGTEMFAQKHPSRRQLEDLHRGGVPGVDLDEPGFAIVLDVIDSKQSDQRKCRTQDSA